MSQPPEMRLPYASPGLRLLPGSEQQTDIEETLPERPVVIPGIALKPAQWQAWSVAEPQLREVLSGGYSPSQDEGAQKPLTDSGDAFLLDTLPYPHVGIQSNEFQLLEARLSELSLDPVVGGHCLSMTPEFTIRYRTTACSATLAEIRLVESRRFITTADG